MEGGGKRACLVWPRRHGKDLTSINWTAFASQQRVGTYWMVYPYLNQGKRIAWNGISGNGVKFLSAFPDEIIHSRSNKDMMLELTNGSVFQVMGADYPDRMVGSNPVGIVFSEWSLMDPIVWQLTLPILTENGGWAVFIYTPRGENHGYSTLFNAGYGALKAKNLTQGITNGKAGRWFCSKLTAADCKVLTKEQLREAREEVGDENLFQQEFFTSFSAPIRGAYYDSQMKQMRKDGRICDLSWEPKLPVHTAWDLGMDDATTIVFFQEFKNEIRIIDYYENSGEGLLHYVKHLRSKDYLYGRHIFPWDIEIRELGTGKSRKETLQSMGLKVGRAAKKLPVEDGIEAVRNLLPRVWIDPRNCHRLIESLKGYVKEWDEERKVFRTKPLHNWCSHAADAMRTLAVGIRDKSRTKLSEQRRMKTTWDIFGT